VRDFSDRAPPFLGSEYFARQLALDPQRTLERYGDGYALNLKLDPI
jgi:hypothetical protein